MTLLRVRNITKSFGETVAINHVSFDVAEGEVCCLVGTSGCGKSTLLSLIAGLDAPTHGYMELDGRRITGPGSDRGMVFQRDCLFPWLSVRDNVRFALKLRANQTSEAAIALGLDRADHLVDAVGLGRFRDSYPKELSGGMRQRAAIARALVNQPRVLLMDEPFGALDAQTREAMQNLLLDIAAEQKTTVLFVTHDVEEAVFLGDRVIVLKAHPGELIADLPVDLPRPRRPEVKLDDPFNHLRRHVLTLIHQNQRLPALRETPIPATSGRSMG